MKKWVMLSNECKYDSYHTGGLRSYVERTAGILSSSGDDVQIISVGERNLCITENGVRYFIIKNSGALICKVTRKLSSFGVPFFRQLHECATALTKALSIRLNRHVGICLREADVVLAHSTLAPSAFLSAAIQSKTLYRFSSCRSAYQFIDTGKISYFDPIMCLEKFAATRARACFAPSVRTARILAERHELEVSVIPTPFPDALAFRAKSLRDNRMKILFVGRFMKRKGGDVAIRVADAVAGEGLNISLAIIGDVKDKRLLRFALDQCTHLTEEHIEMLGDVDKETVIEHINNADVVLLPSLEDNLPNAAIEALCAGVPIVAFQDSSIDELLYEKAFGIAVPKNDYFAMKTAVIRVLENPRSDEERLAQAEKFNAYSTSSKYRELLLGL